MAQTDEVIEGPTLQLYIDNKEPLGLEAIAALLSAVGRDYKQWSGREITVQSVRRGSLTVELIELGANAIAIIGAVVTLKDFAELLRDLVGKAKVEPAVLTKTRSPGVKTVRALIKASRDTSANIEISYASEAEQIFVRLTRDDAERLHLADQHRAQPSTRVTSALPDILSPDQKLDHDIETWVKRIAVSGDVANLNIESDPALALAKILVVDVRQRSGGLERLQAIARSLRAQQRPDAAQLLERLITS